MSSAVIEKLTPRHRRMMEMLVLEGATQVRVCEEFDITQSRLSLLTRAPLWVQAVVEMERDLREEQRLRIQSLVPAAIEALAQLVRDETDGRLRLSSAKEILDRGGFSVVTKLDVTERVDPVALLESLKSVREQRESLEKELGLSEGK